MGAGEVRRAQDNSETGRRSHFISQLAASVSALWLSSPAAMTENPTPSDSPHHHHHQTAEGLPDQNSILTSCWMVAVAPLHHPPPPLPQTDGGTVASSAPRSLLGDSDFPVSASNSLPAVHEFVSESRVHPPWTQRWNSWSGGDSCLQPQPLLRIPLRNSSLFFRSSCSHHHHHRRH